MNVTEIVFLDKKIEQKALAQSFSVDGASKGIIEQIASQAREKASSLTIATKKERDSIVSLAAQVASTKVALDNFGKNLVSDAKTKIKIVDDERKRIRTFLDELKEDIRGPVTKFENEQKERIENAQNTINKIKSYRMKFSMSGERLSSILLKEDLSLLDRIDISFLDEQFKSLAEAEKSTTVDFLNTAIYEAEKYEKEQEELKKLRKIQEEQEIKDREEAIRKSAEEKAKKDQQEAIDRLERERVAEIERIEREKNEEIARIEAEKLEAIEAEKRRALKKC